MGRLIRSFLFIGIGIGLVGCAGSKPADEEVQADSAEAGRKIEVTLLHFNDVYEITAVEAGARGGLARVATLRKQLLAENPNTITLLPGDFLSPSAIGTAKVDGERLAGKQMVAVLNALGLDFVTFGNHEFDLSREQLLTRMAESEFEYISGNVADEHGDPFPNVAPYRIVRIPSSHGDTLRIAVLGVTLGLTAASYVTYGDYVEVVRDQVDMLQDSADVFLAMTHLFLENDVDLVEQVPELDLVIGGHEHENVQVWRGPDLTPIAKADANARSVYVDRLRYDFETGKLDLDVQLVLITDDIPDDPATAAVVDDWVERAWKGFRESGFDPAEPVAILEHPFDGRESVVRNEPTRLTELIADAMRHAAGDVDVVLYNSGSIRIDDVLPPGPVTQYDVIRVLPFGGDIVKVEMTGGLLDSVLTQGVNNRGEGGFLQVDGASNEDGRWVVDGEPLVSTRAYPVALNDFLLLGIEAGFDYLTLDDPRITRIDSHGDIRLAVIEELKRVGAAIQE